MDRVGQASAPGKIILSGEHSVVYGYPALVSAISLRCTAYAQFLPEPGIEIISRDLNVRQIYSLDEVIRLKDIPMNKKTDNLAYAVFKTIEHLEMDLRRENGVTISISSEIPISAGLGSSAASAVASVGAVISLLREKLENEVISKLAYEGEVLAHGTPSGVDNAAATYGGFLKYEKGEITKLDIVSEVPLLIVNSMVPRETKKLVGAVRERYNQNEAVMKNILAVMGKIPQEMIQCLSEGDYNRMGQLMEINHGLLEAIGVGHQALSEIVWEAKKNGALGAKLTGAGGGGCGIILPENEEQALAISHSLQERQFKVFPTKVSHQGVKIAG
ncbi:MAG: mevalonate kinase [Methanobacteriota archaeon]|nr:MAG: mevalonate kinase [Euryarchaeota archaeon]